MIGKVATRAISLLRKAPRRTHTITLDNGTEFHGYKTIVKSSGTTVYFATRTIPGSEAPARTPMG